MTGSISPDDRVTPALSPALTPARLISVDILRGIVMVLMALDHVRDHFSSFPFSPTDLTRTTPELFFTRWITHFCAPVFVFLAGTSAFLSLQRGYTKGQLARFLLVRGILLIILELTAISFAWNFDTRFGISSLQVIWALGWSMIALAGMIFLPRWVIIGIAVVMIAGHNLFDSVTLASIGEVGRNLSWKGWLLSVLHVPHGEVLYPLIPWIGVMAAGYGLGPVLLRPDRRRVTIIIGLILTVLFVVIRTLNGYGDPQAWEMRDGRFSLLAFLNTEKYPPSLLYLLMTLGPALMLLGVLDTASGWFARVFITFGRVPLFFYMVHLYVIHALAGVVGQLNGYNFRDFLVPYPLFPAGYGFNLPIVYVVWFVVVLILFPLCWWFGKVRQRYRLLRYF